MIVDSALYVDGVRRQGRFDTAEAAELPEHSFSWTGLFEPTKAEFDQIRRHVDLHDLVVEDALNAHQRPKLEQYGDALFLVLKTAKYLDNEENVDFGEIQVFVTPKAVLHVRHKAPSKLVDVRARLEEQPDRLGCGPGAVLHAIVDQVVDGYEPVVDGLEQDVREVEREVFNRHLGDNPVERVYGLMRTVLIVQDALSPLVGPLGDLSSKPFPTVHPGLREYFRDAHDHLVAVVQRVGTLHDLLTGILAANLTRVSIRQNEDMRKISAWVAIAAVPTMIAGVYGMNFDHMPELRHQWGYPLVLSGMFAACFALYRKFKSSGWL
ncbi:MAG: magnesium and cobalt transport protein CorA [Ilumatobacteraceae bacterium]